MVIAISMIIRVVKVPATIDTKYFARSDRSVASVLGNPIPVKRLQIVIALYLNMWIDLCIEWTAIFSYAPARSSRVIHVPNHASEPTVDRRSRWYKSDTLPTPSPPCALLALLPSTFHSQTLTLFKLFCPSYTHPYCIYQLLHCCSASAWRRLPRVITISMDMCQAMWVLSIVSLLFRESNNSRLSWQV